MTREIVPPESTVPLLRLWGPRGRGSKPGKVDRNHGEGDLANYQPIEGCEPPAAAYLLVDVERGEEFFPWEEIEEARWFSRDELRAAIEAGEVLPPSGVSIAARLIEMWYGEPLADLA